MSVQYEARYLRVTEATIQELFETQYSTYRMGRVVAAAVAGVALVAAGLFAPVPVLARAC